MSYTPEDWKEPDWYNIGRVHDWKRYVSGELEGEWKYFKDDQKKILARCFQEIVDREEWD